MNKKKYWSERVVSFGIRVRLYERPASPYIWARVPKRYRDALGWPERVSTGTVTKKDARAWVKAQTQDWVQRGDPTAWALRSPSGQTSDPKLITLGEVFSAYFISRYPDLSKKWQMQANTRRRLFTSVLGDHQIVGDMGLDHMRRYKQARAQGNIRGDRVGPVRDGAIHADLRWLSSVFNWACRQRSRGVPMLYFNPISEHVGKFREKNPQRPIASLDRYNATQQHTNTVDPSGALHAFLAVIRYTGRRLSAVRHLRANDFLRTQEQIRTCLAELGLNEADADKYPNGAIHWRKEHDKNNHTRVAPITADLRRKLDAYVMNAGLVGEAWVFPGIKDPSQPMTSSVLRDWLLRAEQLAGLPKLKNGLFHPYRRLFATERKGVSDIDAAAAGGWASPAAMKISYQQTDAETLQRVVDISATQKTGT